MGIVKSDSKVEVLFDETTNLSISTSGKDRSDKCYGTNSLLEQWRDSYPDNDDYDLYDDDMYKNHDLSEHMQSICDDLDITGNPLPKKITQGIGGLEEEENNIEDIDWDSVSYCHHSLNPSPSSLVPKLHSLSFASVNGDSFSETQLEQLKDKSAEVKRFVKLLDEMIAQRPGKHVLKTKKANWG
nr:hypothetical protein [Tanacetum cinerariifolium]